MLPDTDAVYFIFVLVSIIVESCVKDKESSVNHTEHNSCRVMYLSLYLFLSLEEVEINNLMFQTWNDASSVVGSNILTCPTLTNGTQYITGH